MFLIASQVARVFLVSGKTVFAIAKLAGALMSLFVVLKIKYSKFCSIKKLNYPAVIK